MYVLTPQYLMFIALVQKLNAVPIQNGTTKVRQQSSMKKWRMKLVKIKGYNPRSGCAKFLKCFTLNPLESMCSIFLLSLKPT